MATPSGPGVPLPTRRAHVVFVSVGYAELLGVEMLSAVLKLRGHRTSLVHDPALFADGHVLDLAPLARRTDRLDEVVQAILALEPDLVAFSCMTATWPRARTIARRLRAFRELPTVFGGTHPSAAPEHVLEQEEVDYLCVGEGEHALTALVEELAAGGRGQGIPGIWCREGGHRGGLAEAVEQLDSLPLPDKALYAPTWPTRGMYNIMTSRGCPYRCAFCFNSAELPDGRRAVHMRRRSVEGVLAELRWWHGQDAFRYVEFHDDVFTTDRAWLAELAPRYRREIGVPFGCSSHARCLDAERLALLKEAGCVRLKMGVQSLDSPTYRRQTLRRIERTEDIARAIAGARAAGLRVEVDHIVGLPGEAPEARQAALDFYAAHTPDRIGAYRYTWFPGTELTRRAVAEGVLLPQEHRAILDGGGPGFHNARAGDPERVRLDETYAAALGLLPHLPAALRPHMRLDRLVHLPALRTAGRLAPPLAMLAAMPSGGGRDVLAYLRWYKHQLVRPRPLR